MKIAIPARYASSRFPGKPLAMIAGKPMIEHVWRRAVLAADSPADVVVATDDQRIADAVSSFGGNVVMTAADHENGTERLAEVADVLSLGDDEIVVNVQGDEPLIDPTLIRLVGQALAGQPDAGIATAADRIQYEHALDDPGIVKVVTDSAGFAHYFSRSAIPYNRDGGASLEVYPYARHIGIYAYRVATLRFLATSTPAPTEQAEKLEQLRALWHGIKIYVADYDGPPSIGVDVPGDVALVEAILANPSESGQAR